MFAITTTQRTIGIYVFGAVVIVGAVLFIWTQLRIGRKEAGAEIELAANRGPGQSDEELEGPRLNLALWGAFGLLVVIGLALPLYWLAEGGRQVGAVDYSQGIFEERGLVIYEQKAQCAGCHGPEGTGGVASFVITDEAGEYVDTVAWEAPALNNVLWRYSQDEVKDILTYGRPGTPMPAWGVAGGGPLSEGQLDNVIDYLWSVQLTNDEMQEQVMGGIRARDAGLADRLEEVQATNAEALALDPTSYECTSGEFACLSDADQLQLGEILFNLGEVASGAYSCARCHIPGASFGKSGEPIADIARGRYAPNLEGIEDNLTLTQHFNLVMSGTEFGVGYGANNQGSGRMPGFGLNANNGDEAVPQLGTMGMLTPEQVWAIVIYERNLPATVTATAPEDLAAAAASAGGNADQTAEAGAQP